MGGPGVLSPWRRLAAALASLMRPTDRSRGRPTPGSRFRPDRPRLVRQVSATALVLVVTACGPGRSSVATASPSELDDAAWQVLARPRVPQLTGAVRISVGEIALLDENPWGLDPSVPSSVGISELVATGLLRRRDVHFVERRRFAAAAELERRGESRASGAPPAGVSPGPEFILLATWASFGAATAYLESRLIDPASGRVEHAWRTETPRDADVVGVSRAIVGGLLAELGRMGRIPAWSDPFTDAAPTTFERTNISVSAVNTFFAGLASEEVWDWEGARAGYQAAEALDASFFEADVALARTARLRSGGTLGSS